MKRLLERCAALDVHKKQRSACVRILGAGGEIEELNAEFSTMTSQLLALRDWLKGLGITHVAMEITGVYWKPVYYALEDDFEVLLVNAQHVKNVPGRKTDTRDAQWLCQLLECGLCARASCPRNRSASCGTFPVSRVADHPAREQTRAVWQTREAR